MRYRVTERQVIEYSWYVDSEDVEANEGDLESELRALDGVPDYAHSKLIESSVDAVALNADGSPNTCPDCDARIGDEHGDQCDVARCWVTGGQRLSCMMRHDHGDDTWTGRWPGEAEAEEFGWWTTLEPPGQGWKSVPAGTPGAMPDLNRLHREATWDPNQRRFVLR